MLLNPWQSLPNISPFVLPDDALTVAAHNARCDDRYRVQLGVVPEPYIGRIDAPVVFLNINPGWNEIHDPINSVRPAFVTRHAANLFHRPMTFPFYLLDPDLAPFRTTWWEKRLRELIEATSLEAVSRNFLCVEFFPYHSKSYKACKLLPSQDYGFALVNAALQRDAVILMRSRRAWMEAVPALANYPNCYFPSSTQAAHVSRRNYNHSGRYGFDAALNAIHRASRIDPVNERQLDF